MRSQGKMQGFITRIAAFMMAVALLSLWPSFAWAVDSAAEGSDEAVAELAVDEMTPAEIEAAHASDVPIENADVKTEIVEVEAVSDAEAAQEQGLRTSAANSESHKLILVLDVSGSMAGNAMTEMKKACYNFVDEILDEDPEAGISIVTFAYNVTAYTFSGGYFSSDRGALRRVISGLSAYGGTAMNDGLRKAGEIMQAEGDADRQYIITMADGLPNEGATYYGSGAKFPGYGYESAVYNTYASIQMDYEMYSLGFFHSMSGSEKDFASQFMYSLSNRAYFEVTNADLISFTFEEIAIDINSDKLVMSQNSMSLAKGNTGQLSITFTDAYTDTDKTITWGTNNLNVATVDDSGKVTAVGEGECIISAEAGGIMATCNVTVTPAPEKLTSKVLTVYKNNNSQNDDTDDFVLAKGAIVSCGSVDYITGKDGQCKLVNVKSSDQITVSLEGYRSFTLDASQTDSKENVYLQKETDNPIINAVYIDGVNTIVDDQSINYLSKNKTTFSADIDWGKSSAGSVKLVQGTATADFKGNTLSIVLSEKGFDVSKDIYILAKNKDGLATKKKLKIEAKAIVDGIEGMKIGFGSSVKFTAPDSWFIIGGEEFSFDLEKLGDFPFDFNASMDDGKVIVTIGVDVAKVTTTRTDTYYPSGKRKGTPETKNKGVYYDIKNALNKETKADVEKEVKSLKKLYKSALRSPKVNFGVTGDFSVMGYLEGYLDDNHKFQMLEGKICLSPSLGVNWSGQFAIGPVPCYWEAQIKGQIDASLALWRNQSAKAVLPFGELSLDVKGSAGAGVGINQVATIGGGAQLELKPSITFYTSRGNDLKLYVGLNGYFKVKAFLFEYRHDFDPISHTFKNEAGAKSSSKAATNTMLSDVYNTKLYVQEDNSYLEDTQLQVASEDAAAAPNEETGENYADVLQTLHANSYEDTQPRIVSLSGNTKLAVWLDSAGSELNSLQAYYSYYNGETWTDPAVIDEDGTPDNAPSVCSLNNKAYVVWQNAEREISATDDLDSVASVMGIKVAEFKPSSCTFTVSELSAGSGKLDMLPVVQVADGKIVAAWVENTENDWFGTEGNSNTIYASVYDGSAWSEASAIVEGAAQVNSLAADCIGDEVYVAYSCDTDNDPETVNDQELFVNGAMMTDNEVVDSAVRVLDHTLYWYSGGNIMASEVGESFSPSALLDDDTAIPTDDYSIVSDGQSTAILFTVPDQSSSEVYALFAQPAGYGAPVKLTARNNAIRQVDGVWDEDSLVMIANETKVLDPEADPAEDNYGQSDLILMSYASSKSLSLDDVSYIDSRIVPESTLPIVLSVTNDGAQTISTVNVEMLDESGSVVDSMRANVTILSGETATIDYGYLVRESDLGKAYTLRCTPDSTTAASTSKNTQEIKFSFEDLNLEGLSWGINEDDRIVITGALQNLGYSTRDNVNVKLYEVATSESEDEDAAEPGIQQDQMSEIASYEVTSLPSREQVSVQFDVAKEYNKLYFVEVTSDVQDDVVGNDSGYLFIKDNSSSETGRALLDLTILKDKRDYAVGSTLGLSDLSVIAVYDDDTTADVTPDASIDTSDVDMSKEGSYSLHVTYGGFAKDYAITVTAKSDGSSSGEQTYGKTVAVGSTAKVDSIWYEVTSTGSSRTVKVQKPASKLLKKASIKQQITIQNEVYTVTSIGASAFSGCSKLKAVSIPASVTAIGNNAFSGCTSLKAITIPKNVTKIGKKAFFDTSSLRKVTIQTSKLKKSSIGSKAFKNAGSKNYKKLVVKVPKKKVKAYKQFLKKKGLSPKAKIK